MRRIRALLIAACLVASGLLVGVGIVAAQTDFVGCSYYVRLYEDANLGGDNQLTLCTNGSNDLNASNLGNYSVVDGDRTCTKQFGTTPVWNDCAGSFKLSIPSNKCIKMYFDINYRSAIPGFPIAGPQAYTNWNLTGIASDAASSILIYSKNGNGAC